MAFWYVVLEIAVALICVWLVYLKIDVQRRKKRLESEGIIVLSQLLHFASIWVNLVPKNNWGLWLFPHRYPDIEKEIEILLKKHKVTMIGFVSYNFQEVFIGDPKLAKDVTITRRTEFPKPYKPYQILRLFGENVVTAVESGEWKKHRVIVGPAFSEGNNELVADSTVYHLNQIMNDWKNQLKDGQVAVDVDAETVKLALAVIGQAGLGVDLSTATVPVKAANGTMHKLSLRDALQNVCKYLLPRLLIPKPVLYLPFGVLNKIRVSFDEFEIYMKDFCDSRVKKEAPKQIKNKNDAQDKSGLNEEERRKETKRGDLLSKLLENNTVLTTDEIFGDIFIFLVAGHETTAHTLGWAVRYLALRPEVQEKLYQEAVMVLGDRDPTYKDFEDLVYARCVFKETLRLIPQVSGVPKYTEEGTTLGGFNLPPKTVVTLAAFGLHKHEQYWEDPEEFRPERFDNRLQDHKPPDSYAFIPFSVGRRSCLGAKFAQVEGTLALAMMARGWRFELPSDCPRDKDHIFAPMQLLTTQPLHQILMTLKPRAL